MVKKVLEQVLCPNYSVIKTLVVVHSSDNLSNNNEEQQRGVSTFSHSLATQEPSQLTRLNNSSNRKTTSVAGERDICTI